MQLPHGSMCSLFFAARVGVSVESWLEERIKRGKDRMMNDAIPHCCFMYAAFLWIAEREGMIRTMSVGVRLEFPVKRKNMLLQSPLELLYIPPCALPFSELLPCGK